MSVSDTDEEKKPKRTNYLCCDPGVRNCAVAIVSESLEVLWTETFDLTREDGAGCADFEKCRQAFLEIRQEVLNNPADLWVAGVEFQPALRKGGLAMTRNNTWVEGYFAASFQLALGIPTRLPHPSAVKSHFKVNSGSYGVNKQLAIAKATELTGRRPRSDHIADCILLAAFMKWQDTFLPKRKI